MGGWVLDKTINAGHIIATVAIAASMTTYIVATEARLVRLERDQNALERAGDERLRWNREQLDEIKQGIRRIEDRLFGRSIP